MMDFRVEDTSSIEWIEDRLRFLESQHRIRTKRYEDEEQRIQQRYEEQLAEIAEATARAAKKIELEFRAKTEAIKSQYRREECEKTESNDHVPFSTKPQVRPVCQSVLQFKQAVSHQQPVPSQTKNLQSKHFLWCCSHPAGC